MISFRNFSFQYRDLAEPTLKNINLEIQKGEKVLIAGPSGSGKSTLAHCMNGLIPFAYDGIRKGDIHILGDNIEKLSITSISKKIGTILQDQDAQFIGMSVGEDVAFSLENDCIDQRTMKTKVNQVLQTVEMLKYLEQSPHDLSGGQKQRVSLAGVLTTQAEILLFDEPLANLDPANGKKTIQLIDEIHRSTGKTIIIIEHRIEDVLEKPIDRMIVMKDGEIKANGKPYELLSSDQIKKNGLREPLYIEAIKHAGCKLDPTPSILDISYFKKEPYNTKIQAWCTTEVSPSRTNILPLLQVNNASFSYDGEQNVLEDVSFQIQKGEMIALLGNNGAGKSTLSHLITGVLSLKKGNMIWEGTHDITKESVLKKGEKIGYVMQNPNRMITQHMIWDEISLSLQIKGYETKQIRERVKEVLEICGLSPYKNWPIRALSYGQKKRVTIASILALEPKLVILDEPTAGQDYRHYTQFMDFISKLSKEKGLSFLFITHDMHLALEYTDRALVLSEGRILMDDKVEKVLTNPEAINKASLKETSLSKLAELIQLPSSENFIRHFIEYERKVKVNE